MQQLLTAQQHEQGAWLEIISQLDAKPTGIKFLVVGVDSKTYRKAEFDNMKAVRMAEDFEQVERANIAFYLAIIKDVEGLEPEVTLEQVITFAPYVRDQISVFLANRKNFTNA